MEGARRGRPGPDRPAGGPRDPGDRRARSRPRQGHRPPRHQAGQHLRDTDGTGEDPRLRPGQAPPRTRRLGALRRRHGRPAGRAHEPRLHDRHALLHVAGAGARPDARRPQRSVLVRRRALRARDRHAGLRRRHARRRVPGDLQLEPAPDPPQSRAAAGARPDHRQGAREGPRAALPDGRRAALGPAAAAPRPRLGQVAGRRLRAGGAGAASGALRRRALLREPQQHQGRRVLPRRHDRGHHHRAHQDRGPQGLPAPRRDGVPGPPGHGAGGRARAPRGVRRERQPAARRQPTAG